MDIKQIELHWDINRAYKGLEKCQSATKISQVLFGVAKLTHLIELVDLESSKRIRAFFGDNHSGLITWAKAINVRHSGFAYFRLEPQHAKTYKKLVTDLGQDIATAISLNRDASDICTGYEFIRACKKRMAKFQKDIIGALPLFPKSSHGNMIHDYILQRMEAEERKNRPKLSQEQTLPMPQVDVTAIHLGEFNILIPRNELDLKRIGRAQNHCVGNTHMGYGKKIKRNEVYIFAVYTRELADGVCVEMDKQGRFIQIQGKHRREPDDKEKKVINKIKDSILIKALPQAC